MSVTFRLRLLRCGGAGLVILGVVHLIATPHIASLIRRSTTVAVAQWLIPPMLLNHILVGVLLIPLGYLAVYAAPHSVHGASWARMIVRTVSICAATLPIALLSLMATPYFLGAPLFVAGAALTMAVPLVLLWAAFGR